MQVFFDVSEAKEMLEQVKNLKHYGHLSFEIKCFGPILPYGGGDVSWRWEAATLVVDTSYGVSLRAAMHMHHYWMFRDIKFRSFKSLERFLLGQVRNREENRIRVEGMARKSKEKYVRRWVHFLGMGAV